MFAVAAAAVGYFITGGYCELSSRLTEAAAGTARVQVLEGKARALLQESRDMATLSKDMSAQAENYEGVCCSPAACFPIPAHLSVSQARGTTRSLHRPELRLGGWLLTGT